MIRPAHLGAIAASLVTVVFAACAPGSGTPLDIDPKVDGGDEGGTFGDASNLLDVDLGDSFALIGLTPSHGPWTGGTRAILRGRGFPSNMRVWVGGIEVPAKDIFASDPTHASITIPQGIPGPADVKIRDDGWNKERVLAGGYLYDPFVVTPPGGSTAGGTRLTIEGSGTTWAPGTKVSIGGKDCLSVVVRDKTHLECVTQANTPGAKDVTITDPSNNVVQARDAFAYSDSADGYRGGLSGAALDGQLTVLAFDSQTGAPVPAAKVIVGSDITTALIGTGNDAGLTMLSSAALKGKVTVTVTAHCYQPTTFVDVPVDTVTVFLNGIQDPTCGSDPPSGGNWIPRYAGLIKGELVWREGVEFKEKGDWFGVPKPSRPGERRAAYVFTATPYPSDPFYLPGPDQATTMESPGKNGYEYSIYAAPGAVTVYALAGLEDRTVEPPIFVPYVMGVAKGVPVAPSTITEGADMAMITFLDHQLTIRPEPPTPNAKGPDRVQGQVAVSVGTDAYAILPRATQSALLPLSNDMVFTGLPALDGMLSGESYVLNALAVTGQWNDIPASVISRYRTTNSSTVVTVNGFVPLPVLKHPNTGMWNGTSVEVQVGTAVDLFLFQIQSGQGLVSWTVVAPGDRPTFELPDLSGLTDVGKLVSGNITTRVWAARLESFDYSRLRYGQLGTGSWSAYAVDSLSGSY